MQTPVRTPVRRAEAVRLPDPATSRAVLIGVHAFEHLKDLPAVENNINRLYDALTDPELWGLPKEHCRKILQPRYGQEVIDALGQAADEARDTLFVYYAGHGLLNERATDASDRLCLALTEADHEDRLHWALRYQEVRDKVQQPRRARRKVVVLDCCFSGQAAVAMGPSDLHDEAEIEGAYVLTSSGANAPSYAREGAELTDFTGELLALVEGGVAGGPELLTVEDLYQGVRRAAAHKGLAKPHKLATDQADRVALVRNRRWVPELPPASPAAEGAAPAGRLSRYDLDRLIEAQKKEAASFPYEDLLEGFRRPRFTEVYVRQQMTAQGLDAEHHGDGMPEPSRPGEWSRSREREERRAEAGAPALEGKQDRRVSQSLKSVLESPEHLLITGGPGMGKSSLISQLPRDLPKDAVPIRVTAKRLAPHALSHQPWQEAIAASVEKGMLPAGLDRLPDRPAPDGRWVILIDALDEVSDIGARDRLVDWVDGILGPPRDLPFRLILTSRPPTPADRDKLIRAGMAHYTLEPFTADGLERFAAGWFHDAPVRGQAERFLAQLREGHLLDVAKVPLLATIAAIVFENSPDKPLPKQRFDLYEEFLTHLAEGRGKRVKEGLRTLLEDLPNSGRLVDEIRQRRSELGRRLAVAASQGETDLLGQAETWTRQLAKELDVAIPVTPRWRKTLFALAEYTGLVTRDGDNVRFWHLSFAEHLAAEVHEADLPGAFDPEAEVWGEWLDRIFDGTGQEEVARLVLVRHTHNHPDSALLPWLQQRTDRHQALVGELLLRGAQAAGPVLKTFCTMLRRVLILSADERDDVLTTAALLGDPEVSATLVQVMEDDAVATTGRVVAAQLLSERSEATARTAVDYLWTVIDNPHIPDTDRVRAASAVARSQHPSRGRAAEALLATARDDRIDFSQRRTAAEALANLGGDRLAQAQGCLIDLMQNPGASAQHLVPLAETLAKLSSVASADALSALETLAEDPATTVSNRIDLLRVIPLLDPGRGPRSLDVLEDLMTSGKVTAGSRAKAAQTLAAIAPGQSDLAVGVLWNLVRNTRLDMYDRMDAAERLADLDATHRVEVAEELFRLAQSPHCPTNSRIDPTVKSASLAPRTRDRCLALLASIAADPAHDWDERLRAVSNLSEMDPQNLEQVVPVLEDALSAPGVRPRERAKAADYLGRLSDAHRTRVVGILLERMSSAESGLKESWELAETLALLAPEHTEEAEAALTRALESPFLGASEREEAARSLVRVAPHTQPRVVETLLSQAAAEPDAFYVWWMATSAVEIDPGQREAAARILRSRLTGLAARSDGNRWAARGLTELGGAQERAELIRLFQARVTEATTTEVRLAAADDLATIDPRALEAVVDALVAIASDDSCPAPYRVQAAARIGGIGRAHHEAARRFLESIVADELCDAKDREKAQHELQNLHNVPPPLAPA
ncbi:MULTISPECIES: caspase, EACC1-associated type [Streptomyces violaceusniger group]|uniref:Peptidase C14 caspase domain-containing protein n=2 Tax=Streptomyces rhizosphaericus TaxID=114699 RepID=A0ABN1SJY8_9ACTN|nr:MULTISPECIES: caspase family protein [Streptomyces violaceusniger group]